MSSQHTRAKISVQAVMKNFKVQKVVILSGKNIINEVKIYSESKNSWEHNTDNRTGLNINLLSTMENNHREGYYFKTVT